MSEEERKSIVEAWDRVGEYLESVGLFGKLVVDRNFELWKSVSNNLRKDPITSDTLAANTGSILVTMQKNIEDAWRLMAQPPVWERNVLVLPTAFLFFDRTGEAKHLLADPIFVAVPPDRDNLPATAEIALSGTGTRTADSKAAAEAVESVQDAGGSYPDRAAVAALTARLRARHDAPRHRYKIETIGASGKEATNLDPGVYDGVVYLTGPALPLANLRVVVEGPPPSI